MIESVRFVAAEEDSGERADVIVARHLPEVSRSLARTLIEEGKVSMNGLTPKVSGRVSAGDLFQVEVVFPLAMSARPEDIPLTIVYQDRDLAVIDKPAGMVVHPSPGHESGTLANALMALFPQTADVGTELRPGIVHRLDKDTSGLLVVALTPGAHRALQEQISTRSAGRRYLALVDGNVQPDRGTIVAPIGRDLQDRKRMATYGVSARPARTSYEVLEHLGHYSFVEASLHTGRTHQIRVHLSAMGHPVVGDRLYGGSAYPGLERHFLHAHRLTIRSPSTDKQLDLISPLPADLQDVLDVLQSA